MKRAKKSKKEQAAAAGSRKQAAGAGRRGRSTKQSPAPALKPDRKKAQKPSDAGSGSDYREGAPTMRFDATIHAPDKKSASRMDQLDIDRVPDPKGLVRALVTAADLARLLDQGFEVHLHQAHPVQPLNPKLIETDKSVRRWLNKKLGTKSRKQ
jgi:hypothetical protein